MRNTLDENGDLNKKVKVWDHDFSLSFKKLSLQFYFITVIKKT